MQKLLSVCLFFFVLPGFLIAETLTDNFNDNSLNSELWDTSLAIGSGSVSETNQRLEVVASAPDSLYGVMLKTDVVGDFSAKVNYELLAMPHVNGEPLAVMALNFISKSFLDDPLGVGRGVSNEPYEDVYGGAVINEVSVPTSHTYGTLRFTRVGSVMSAYYWDSGWQLLDQGITSAEPLHLFLGVVSGDGTMVSAAFDNFMLGPPDTIYFPQIANGGGYTTTFTIFNPTSNVAIGTLTLRDGEGNPLIFSMMNGSTDSQFDLSIPANGSVRLVSSGTGNIETGWAVIESSEGLQGVATFDYKPISVLLDSVGVNSTLWGNRFIMPIDISPSADEGLAIVNPCTSDVAVRLTLIDEDGSTYASLDDPQLNPLSANKSLSLYATELFPSLQSGSFKGLLDIEVIGSGNIAVIGLSYKEGQISIIPVYRLGWSFM